MEACCRWFGRRAAILAGLFMTTCFGFLSNHGARSGNSGLTLFSKLSGRTERSYPYVQSAVVAESDRYLLIDSHLPASSANGLDRVTK